MGGISSAEREAVQLKRYSVYIPDDLKLPHDSLPSPPTTPPDEQQIPRRLSHQLSSTTAKHPFPAPPSSFALAHRRRSLVSFSPPLSPPSAAPADQALPGHFSPSSTTSESRPPSTTTTRPFSRSNTSSARISASPVQPQRPAPSRVKRKPVPQIEEDMEVVDDPLWDPTTGKRASRSKERTAMDSTGVEGQLRRLSVEERASGHPIFDSRAGASSGTETRATKPLPRANPPLLFAPQAPSTPLDMAPVIRRSGFTFGAPLPVASSASSVEDRDSATTSRVSSFSNERLSVDTGESPRSNVIYDVLLLTSHWRRRPLALLGVLLRRSCELDRHLPIPRQLDPFDLVHLQSVCTRTTDTLLQARLPTVCTPPPQAKPAQHLARLHIGAFRGSGAIGVFE